jgi:MFS family permease
MPRLFPARLYYGWVMVGTALTINAAVSPLNAVVFSFLIAPIADDLGVAKSALAWSLTLRLFAAGLTGPWMGPRIDRYGARWLGAGCGFIGGTALLALSQAHSLWLVLALFTYSGLAGFGGPAGQLLTQVPLAKWFVVQRGRALAIATTGMALGTVFVIPITQWLVLNLGWRLTTIIFGLVVAGVVMPVSILLVRRSPEDLGLHPDGAPRAYAAGESGLSARAARLTTTEDWTVAEAMRTPAMWLLLSSTALAGAALTGTLVYRVSYWQSLGMSPALVGLGTALDPLCVVFSALAFGLVADRVAVRYLGFIGLLGFGASVVPMVVSQGETWTILAHGALWGTAAGGYITLNNMVWPNYFGREFLGAIRGIVLPVSVVASGIGAPLVGYLLDALPTQTVWMVSTGSFLVAAVMVLAAKPPTLSRAAASVTLTEVEAGR